jgi:CO/xanthine dehydrogenase Mo-binding subunit
MMYESEREDVFLTNYESEVLGMGRSSPDDYRHERRPIHDFGRRASAQSDYLIDAVSIAQAAAGQGHKVPIKLVWTREEDMRGGYYRPAYLHRVSAGVSADGKVAGSTNTRAISACCNSPPAKLIGTNH